MSTKKENKIYLYCIILLIIVSIVTIIFTKYNKYYENRTINEIKKNVIIVKDGKVKKENEGKLVLVNGKLDYGDTILHDDLFWINVKTPRLFRFVEMYQWYETSREDENGKIIYEYKKAWLHNVIDSSKFNEKGYDNPQNKVRGTWYFSADNIKVGNYILSNEQIDKLDCNVRLKLNPNIPLHGGFRIYDNYATNSVDPENPQIGDNRISYYYNDWEYATVLAKQSKNSFENYTTKTKKKINFVENEKLNLENLIKNKKG